MSKRARVSKLLILALVGFSALAFADTDPIPQHWGYVFTTIDKPRHRAYGGLIKQINDDRYLVWSKAEFLEPQHSPAGDYATDIIELEMRCKPPIYMVLREIRYAAEGKLVSDVDFPYGKKAKHYSASNGAVDLGKLPLDESFAEYAFLNNDVCVVVYDD